MADTGLCHAAAPDHAYDAKGDHHGPIPYGFPTACADERDPHSIHVQPLSYGHRLVPGMDAAAYLAYRFNQAIAMRALARALASYIR